MNRKITTIGINLALAFCSYGVPAYADWQFTKWGMSVEQVIRASAGQLRLPTPEERSAQAVNGLPPSLMGNYRSSMFTFTCALYFPPKMGLGRVTLTPTDYGESRSIIESLRGLYGEPVQTQRTRFGDNYRWRDDAHNNGIEVYDFSSIHLLNVFYTPLRSGAEKGL